MSVESNLASGYVRVYRSLAENPIWRNASYLRIWLYLLFEANWKDRQLMDGTVIKRGSLATGRVTISLHTKTTEQTVRSCLKCLISTNMITIESTKRGSIVSICNYDIYQPLVANNQPTEKPADQPTANQQVTNSQPTGNQPTNHSEEVKKGRRKEKNIAAGAASGSLFDPQGDQDAFDLYEEAQIAIWKFWPECSKRCTRADVKAILHRAVKPNGRTKEALAEYVAAARLYRDSAGDYVLRFKEYARLAMDGPVVPPNFNRSNGNGVAKPDHGIKPKLDFHVAQPRPADAEEIRWEVKRGEK